MFVFFFLLYGSKPNCVITLPCKQALLVSKSKTSQAPPQWMAIPAMGCWMAQRWEPPPRQRLGAAPTPGRLQHRGAARDDNSDQNDCHQHILKYSLDQNIILRFDCKFELSGSTVRCSCFYPPSTFPLKGTPREMEYEVNGQEPISSSFSWDYSGSTECPAHPSQNIHLHAQLSVTALSTGSEPVQLGSSDPSSHKLESSVF